MNYINEYVILETDKKPIKLLIDRVIGEGKTSTVFLAYIENNSVPYALKIQNTPAKDMSICKISNKCKCIPYVYNYGKIHDSYATLIEYYNNTIPLNKKMFKGNKVLSFTTVLRIGILMLPVLKELHNNSLEYPDLSPANIACIMNDNLELKLYDFDALRTPSTIYDDKVGKQHESFYSCMERKHSYADDLCSLIFIMITLLGGTYWNYKHITNMAKQGGSFFTRLNQLNESKEPYCNNKYDNSPYKNEYRRLLNIIKKNVYNVLVEDISELIESHYALDHVILEDLLYMNFQHIHNSLCEKYNIGHDIKYRGVIGLYLLAIYITEYSYSKKSNKDQLYSFIDSIFNYLNINKITNIDKTKLFYDMKINLINIGYDRIYK